MASLASRARRVASADYFGEYHGHLIEHLEVVHTALRGPDGQRPIIWLAGDSSLDNKHWLLGQPRVRPVDAMRSVLEPPRSVPDVAHQLAAECERRGLPYAVINCAVEESTLGARCGGSELLPQDRFLRDHLRTSDIVVVSVGGNDVALRPTFSTVTSMAALVFCAPSALVRSGWALGLRHFLQLYRRDGSGYLNALTLKCTLAAAPAITKPSDTAGDVEPTSATKASPRASKSEASVPPALRPACAVFCSIYFPDQVQ